MESIQNFRLCEHLVHISVIQRCILSIFFFFIKGLQFNLKQKSNFGVQGASKKMLAGFQITKQNRSGTGKMQITYFPNADNRNLLQAAVNIAKHYAFH